jgi:hypothetical protein
MFVCFINDEGVVKSLKRKYIDDPQQDKADDCDSEDHAEVSDAVAEAVKHIKPFIRTYSLEEKISVVNLYKTILAELGHVTTQIIGQEGATLPHEVYIQYYPYGLTIHDV